MLRACLVLAFLTVSSAAIAADFQFWPPQNFEGPKGGLPKCQDGDATVIRRDLHSPGVYCQPSGGASSVLYSSDVSFGSFTPITRNFVLSAEAVVSVSCSVSGSVSGAGGINAGVMSTLSIDGTVCSQDISFEYPAYNVLFGATAVCNKKLAAGNHTITCLPSAYGQDSSAVSAGPGSFGVVAISTLK